MSHRKLFRLLVAIGFATSGCAGSIRELKKTASRHHNCPKDKIQVYFRKDYKAMLDVCGTDREYHYQAKPGTSQLLCPPQSWREVAITYVKFNPQWYDSMWLYDSWGTSATNIWVVGSEGAVFHFDGKQWSALDCETNPPHYLGVWGADANAIWIVGSKGKVLRWDGKTWTHEQLPTMTTLIGVHGTSQNDIWIVGRKGLVIHWDGTELKPIPSGVKRDLYRVFAISRDLAWAVGEKGTLLMWDGKKWTPKDLGTQAPLVTVWARSTKDAWVGARNGQVFRWNGQTWSAIRVHTIEDMKQGPGVSKILGFDDHDVWIMDSQVHHFDGRVWRRLDKQYTGQGGYASWGSSSQNVYGFIKWGWKNKDYRTREEYGEQAGYYHWNGKRWTKHQWPVWPCNKKRGKLGPRPLPLRPAGPGY